MAIDITPRRRHYNSTPTAVHLQSNVPSPLAIGLPAKYTSFRDGQWEYIDAILNSQKQFIGLQLPTGTGKSLIEIGAGLLAEGRAACLTATKTLSDQLYGDMSSAGLVDIRGLNNYLCLALANGGEWDDLSDGRTYNMSCEDGPCMFGMKCDLKFGGCLYFDILREAQRAKIVGSNYSYWMHNIDQAKPPLGKFNWLFMDEAHDAVDQITKFLTVELSVSEVEGVIGSTWLDTTDLRMWRQWAVGAAVKLESRYRRRQEMAQQAPNKSLLRELRMMRRLLQKVNRVAQAVDWIVFPTKDNALGFSPLWPKQYTKNVMFGDIPHVVLMSATLTRKTLELLGVAEEGDTDSYDYFEAGSRFPIEHGPIYWIPTVAVTNHSEVSELQYWVSRMDQVIDGRPDRKGIIHTTSYNYRNFILANSRNSHRFITHGPSDARQQIEKFKLSNEPLVLISPSVGTGHDFPGDMCRFQIVSKVPFPDSTDPLTAARCADDKEYGLHVAAQKIVQMVPGRGERSEVDWCENFIMDNQIVWLRGRHNGMFPYFWHQRWKGKTDIVPPAMRGVS